MYTTITLGLVGVILAGLGLAEFDHSTGRIDLAPFNLYAVGPIIAAPIATAVAAMAVVFKWGPSSAGKS
jgi:hypothetical protein